jgi:hypothetical protein
VTHLQTFPVAFACEHSTQVGEQLFGTAPRVDVWFLLEHTAPWGGQALDESSIPQPVKDRLNEYVAAIPNARLQLMRQTPNRNYITFYVGLSKALDPVLYRFELPDYEALLDLDIAAIMRRDLAYEAHLTYEPLYLICTNGKRDACCAKFGLLTYRALVRTVGNAVWETTHVGGHRFAATMLCFPHGIYYGRIAPGEAKAITTAYQQGRILPDKLRGRSCYDKPAQMAEYFLRHETEIDDLAAFRLQDVLEVGAGQWRVTFERRQDGRKFHVTVAPDGSIDIYKNSGASQTVSVPQFVLAGYHSAT